MTSRDLAEYSIHGFMVLHIYTSMGRFELIRNNSVRAIRDFGKYNVWIYDQYGKVLLNTKFYENKV